MGEGQRISVVLADDHPVFRDGMAQALTERDDLELVGQAENGIDALELIRQERPDVALFDVRMPALDGLTIVERLQHDDGPTKVVLLSAHLDPGTIYKAIAAGAAGYLSKRASRPEICDALVGAAQGLTVISPEAQSSLADQIRVRASSERPLVSDREREILALTASGMSAPDIAAQLFLSPTTVKTHLQNVYEKLGVSDRAAAVAEAMRRGIVQ